MYLPLIAIFIAISGSMGISYMAEGSLPGEPLYPVKIHINNNFKQPSNDKDVISLPMGERNEVGSSDSVYLHASSGVTASSSAGDSALPGETNVDTSTELDAKQVINTR